MRRILVWLLGSVITVAALIVAAMREDTPAPTGPTPPANVKTAPGVSAPASCRDTDRRNIPYGDRDYAPWLDGDGDGLACETTRPK